MIKSFKHWFVPEYRPIGEFVVRGVAVGEVMSPGVVDRPHGTGDWLFMCFHGPVIASTEGCKEAYPNGGLVIWSPRHGHYYRNPEQAYSHSWMHCGGTYVERLVRENMLPIDRMLTEIAGKQVDEHLWRMFRELSHPVADVVIVENIFENWLRDIGRSIHDTGGEDQVSSAWRALQHYIHAHYNQPLSVAHLARRMNLSVSHFSAEFRRLFGTAPLEYIIRLRLREAEHLLRDRNLRIQEVAERVGYDNPYYFSRLFHRHRGHSPRACRREWMSMAAPAVLQESF